MNPGPAGNDRWRVFRISPESHDILRFDNTPPKKHDGACLP
ncbi:MAG: hypothetical protein WC661_11740 [Opitutaceae bacterium]